MSNRLIILQPVFAVLRPVWRIFEAFSTFIDKFCQIFGVMILTGMWVLLIANAIAKWTDATTINWTLEITAYMVAWSIFIMMGPITRSNEQIRVSFLPEKVLGEKRAASFMNIVENLAGLVICIYLSFKAYDLVSWTYHSHLRVTSSGGWEYPMWIVRSGVLLGFCFTSLFYFERTVNWIRRFFTTGSQAKAGGDSTVPGGTIGEESIPEPGIDT